MIADPSTGITGIDHLVILVRDLDTARETYERLGFTLTERAEHSASMGTANTCIMLGTDYFELLAVIHPTEANQTWRNILEHSEGPAVIALSTNDADQVYRSMSKAGVDASPPLHFSRDAQTPDGTATAKFSITRLPAGATAPIPMFACQHHTPELVWRPEWQAHENGALGLATVSAVADNPSELAGTFGKLFAADPVAAPSPDTLIIDPGGVPIRLASPARCAEQFPGLAANAKIWCPGLIGFSLTVPDLSVVESLLSSNDVPWHRGDNSIYVEPVSSCGALLEFTMTPNAIG